LLCSDSFVTRLEESFFVGKPVKIKIVNRDPSSSRLVASIKAALPGAVAPTNSIASSGIEVSQIVSGVVSALHAEHLLLTLEPSQAKALLSMSNLANHRGVPVSEIKSSVKLGEHLDGLLVVAKNEDRGLIIVANAPKKKEKKEAKPSGISQPMLSYDSIPVGETIPGRVVSHSQHGALVQITKTLRGRIHPTDALDDFKSDSAFPEVGKLVKSVVLKVDAANKIIDLSIRPSRLSPESAGKIVDKEVEGLEGLEVGQKIRGFVKSISNSGLFVSIGRSTVARVMIKDLFDEVSKPAHPGLQSI
jgi:rRNA biogenesis protein RRP5